MKIKNVVRTLIILVLLVLFLYLITKTITNYTGFIIFEDNKFEGCLKEKNIDLYIEDFNDLENLRTKDYIDYFEIHRCKNKLSCLDKNFSEYPIWIFDGKEFYGDISIFELADITNCELV